MQSPEAVADQDFITHQPSMSRASRTVAVGRSRAIYYAKTCFSASCLSSALLATVVAPSDGGRTVGDHHVRLPLLHARADVASCQMRGVCCKPRTVPSLAARSQVSQQVTTFHVSGGRYLDSGRCRRS